MDAHNLLTRNVILVAALLAAAPAFAADTLTVNPTSVEWTRDVRASEVTVSSTGNQINFTSQVTYGESAGDLTHWLGVSGGSSTTPGSVVLQLVSSPYPLYGSGPFHATVTFSSGGSTATVAVTYSPTATGGGGGSGTSGAISVTPSTLTLSRTGAGAAPGSLTVSSTSATATDFTVAAAPTTTGWTLEVDKTSGSVSSDAPVYIAVTAQTASAAATTYSGTITITPAGQTAISVPVSFQVSGGGTGSLTFTPSSWAVSSAVGGAPQSRTFTVNAPSTVIMGPVGSDQSWLVGSRDGDVLTVTMDPSALAAGTYSGNVFIIYVDGFTPSTTSLPVTLTVGDGGGDGDGDGDGDGGGGGGSQVVAPAQLSFAYQVGVSELEVPSQFVVIPRASGGTYTASVDQSWVFLELIDGSPLGGQLPGVLKVTVHPASLNAQTEPYTANVTIVTPNGQAVVPVRLLVTASPVLAVVPGTLVFEGTSSQMADVIPSNRASVAVTATAPAGASWLHVTSEPSFPAATLTVSVNTTDLATGTYAASIQVAAAGMANSPMNFPVVVKVNGGGSGVPSALTLNPLSLSFTSGQNGAAQQASVGVTSAGGDASFSVVARSGSWLTVTASSLTTPASVQATVNPAGLAAGTYTDHIDFNNRAQSIPVTLVVTNVTSGGDVTVVPMLLNFSHQTGATAPATQSLTVSSGGAAIPYSVSTSTTTGGAWLARTSAASGATQGTVTLSVNPTGLAAGSYSGNVAIQPTGGAIVNVPVTLTVSAAAISVNATELTFTHQLGASSNPAPKTVQVNGGASANYTALATSTGNWLSVTPASGTANPATLTVSVNPANLSAGTTYHGTVQVSGVSPTTGSATIDVTLMVRAPAPTITQIGNAASYFAGSIAPGEILSVFGTFIGPTTPVGLAMDAGGKVATAAGGVKVFFSGYEAPIAYASATQINVVVPYEVKGLSNVNVYTRFLDQTSNSINVPVTATAPGVFTANSTGSGQGAILNGDSSANSSANPAAKGSTVVVYVTGEGETSPAGVTGKVTVAQSAPPLTPVPLGNLAVLIDGQPAEVVFKGEAPGFVSGLMQLNVVIPPNARSGNVPIVVTLGARSSQSGVTVAVQ